MKKWLFRFLIFVVPVGIIGYLIWQNHAYIWTSQPEDRPAPPVTQIPKSFGSYIKKANSLIETQNYHEASLELSKAVKLEPQNPEAYLKLATIYYETGEFEKLQNLTNAMQSTFPEKADVDLWQVRTWLSTNQIAKANQLVSNLPDPSGEIQIYDAILDSYQNLHSQAQRKLKALELNNDEFLPEFKKLVRDINIVYETYETFTEAKSPHLFVLIAKSLADNKEAYLAQAFADIALKEDSTYIDGWVVRGYSFMQQNKPLEAVKDLSHAYELDPIRPQIHYFLALAYHDAGDAENAVLFFEKSLDHNYEFTSDVQWKLVELLFAQGKYEKAFEVYDKLAEQEGVDPQKFIRAVHTAVDLLKNPELAEEFSLKIYEKSPENPESMNLLGWSYIANGKYEEAEKILKKAEKIDRDNARVHMNLGLLYEETGELKKAKAAFQKAYVQGKAQNIASVTNLAAEKYNEQIKSLESETVETEPVSSEEIPPEEETISQ